MKTTLWPMLASTACILCACSSLDLRIHARPEDRLKAACNNERFGDRRIGLYEVGPPAPVCVELAAAHPHEPGRWEKWWNEGHHADWVVGIVLVSAVLILRNRGHDSPGKGTSVDPILCISPGIPAGCTVPAIPPELL